MARPWFVCQIGAREHYAIARALTQAGQDLTLITDYWSRGGQARGPKRLAQRHHEQLSDSRVVSFNRQTLLFELLCTVRRRRGWDKTIARNRWFGRSAARCIRRTLPNADVPPIVFSYSYAAREIFQAADRFGCPKVLGQIDPGLEEVRLVQRLHERYGMEFRDAPPDSYWDHWQEECELADRIVVNSSWSRDVLIRTGVPQEKLRIIPLVYEKSAKTPQGADLSPDRFSEDRPLRVLFLGQVIVRKGVVELGEAIERLADCPVQWTIVGGGDPRLLERLQSLPRTTVTGSIPRAEAAERYQQADVFILPTHSDGFAITQLEAAAYGLPMIVSPYCGDVVQDGVDGIVISEVSGEAIVQAVQRLLDQPDLVRRCRTCRTNRPLGTMRDLANDLLALF